MVELGPRPGAGTYKVRDVYDPSKELKRLHPTKGANRGDLLIEGFEGEPNHETLTVSDPSLWRPDTKNGMWIIKYNAIKKER